MKKTKEFLCVTVLFLSALLHAYPAASLDIHDVRRNIYDLDLEINSVRDSSGQAATSGGGLQSVPNVQINANSSTGATVIIFFQGDGVVPWNSESYSKNKIKKTLKPQIEQYGTTEFVYKKIRVNQGAGRHVELIDKSGAIRFNFIRGRIDNKLYMLDFYIYNDYDNTFTSRVIEWYKTAKKVSRAELIALASEKESSNTNTSASGKSWEQRKCEAAVYGAKSDLADFMQQLSKENLTKFLESNQDCSIFK